MKITPQIRKKVAQHVTIAKAHYKRGWYPCFYNSKKRLWMNAWDRWNVYMNGREIASCSTRSEARKHRAFQIEQTLKNFGFNVQFFESLGFEIKSAA